MSGNKTCTDFSTITYLVLKLIKQLLIFSYNVLRQLQINFDET